MNGLPTRFEVGGWPVVFNALRVDVDPATGRALAIERLQGRLAEAMAANGLGDVAALVFNTHGESMGRGAHPASLTDRLEWPLSPWARRRFARAGIRLERGDLTVVNSLFRDSQQGILSVVSGTSEDKDFAALWELLHAGRRNSSNCRCRLLHQIAISPALKLLGFKSTDIVLTICPLGRTCFAMQHRSRLHQC